MTAHPRDRLDAELAITAARAAGDVVMRAFGTDMKVTLKSPDQPLTEADMASDRLLKDMLRSARPGYGWLSEETADNPLRLEQARIWVVDPIDGTRSFIAGRPEFSISIAVAERGRPAAGVIYNPATRELYWAVLNGGAWQRTGPRDLPIHANTTAVEKPRMIASRGEMSKGKFDEYQAEWDVAGLGSTAYKMAHVAAGRADAFLSRGPKSEWDVCAGVLIVREAGGIVTDAEGTPFDFNRPDPTVNGVLAASAPYHFKLLHPDADMPHDVRNGDEE